MEIMSNKQSSLNNENCVCQEQWLKLSSRLNVLEERLTAHFSIFTIAGAVLQLHAPNAVSKVTELLIQYRDEYHDENLNKGQLERLSASVRINEINQVLRLLDKQEPMLRVVEGGKTACDSQSLR